MKGFLRNQEAFSKYNDWNKVMAENTYYYKQLNKEQQRAYHAIKTGLMAIAPSFAVPKLSAKELADIYFMVRMDNPEIFYTVKYTYRYYQQADNIELSPEYLFPKKQIMQHQEAMKARVTKLTRQAQNMNEKEKEQYIHDFICQNVRYDKLKKPYSHEIIGPLGHGVGVCEGIAKTVKILCDALGIWCIVALCDNNPEKGIKYRHTWNVVRIGGSYYHLDVTFDNSLGSSDLIRYDYYNLNDTLFFRDHEPVIWKIPACTDGDHFYYKEKKISFTKMEEVAKRAEQYAKKGKVFLFHWRGGYLTKEVLGELLELIGEAARKKGKYVKVSLNWPQSVLQVSFLEEETSEKVTIEEANEGEKFAGNGESNL